MTRVKWLGHAAFYLVSPAGVRVLTDPFGESVPYPPVSAERDAAKCDVVTVSHEHSDHNAVQAAGGAPRILRGLSGNAVARLDETIGDVRFRTAASWHDAEKGAKRGANAIFIMDFPGLTVVHLGDLGHELDDGSAAEIGRCDVLMVPVGGHYTIDAKTATRVTRVLEPRVAIPMHYKTKYTAGWPISGPDEFLSDWARVRRLEPGAFDLDGQDLPGETEIWAPSLQPVIG